MFGFFLPLLMLVPFAISSWRAWHNPPSRERIFILCMHWSMVAVISIAGGIMLLVVGDYVLATILLLLSPVAAYVATRFKHLN